MSTLKEKFINSLSLTANQKTVIAKIAAAPTEKVAAEDISHGTNLVSARDMLMRMGMITFKDAQSATLTDKGRKLAQDENVIDETGSLTDEGKKLVGGGGPETAPMEAFSLVKQLSINEGKMKDLSITVDDFINHAGPELQALVDDGDERGAEKLLNRIVGEFNKEKVYTDSRLVSSVMEILF